MIEAAQVNDNETACQVLETDLRSLVPNAEVRNLGITSAGFVHYYAQWRKFARHMKPDVLIVAATGINDFRNCSTRLEKYQSVQPHYSDSAHGRQVLFQSAPNPHSRARRFTASLYEPLEFVRFLRWLRAARQERVSDGSELFSDMLIYEEPLDADYAEAVAIGREYLTRLIREAADSGSRVIVVYLPWSGESIGAEWDEWLQRYKHSNRNGSLIRNHPEQIVRRVAEDAGVEFLSFSHAISKLPLEDMHTLWHVKTDSHLTVTGNKVLGRFLMSAISNDVRVLTQ